MDPVTICNLIYAAAALIGAVAGLISIIQGVRPPDQVNGEGPRDTTTPRGGEAGNGGQDLGNRILDRLSLLPRGAFRGAMKDGR